MVKVKIYVEGGGDSKSADIECRKGFSEFFRKAGLQGKMPAVIPCGTRRRAFDNFCIAVGHQSLGTIPILLVDAEAPVISNPWHHLSTRDSWVTPTNATDDQCHLMVECMESWFVADKKGLEEFYGRDFRGSALPQNPSVESISKRDVFEGLKKATGGCATKGIYSKSRHSYKILALINPNVVAKVSAHARKLIETLSRVAK